MFPKKWILKDFLTDSPDSQHHFVIFKFLTNYPVCPFMADGQIAHHTSFSQMKAREEAVLSPRSFLPQNMEVIKKDGGFFRKGKI